MLPTNIPRAGVGDRPGSAPAAAKCTGHPYAKTAIGRVENLSVDLCWAARDVAVLRLRALLAQARGDESVYCDYRERYRAMATSPGVSRRRGARRLGPSPIAGTATGGTALQRAQPYGYRIRHEDEKNPSAICMRILQSRR